MAPSACPRVSTVIDPVRARIVGVHRVQLALDLVPGSVSSCQLLGDGAERLQPLELHQGVVAGEAEEEPHDGGALPGVEAAGDAEVDQARSVPWASMRTLPACRSPWKQAVGEHGGRACR